MTKSSMSAPKHRCFLPINYYFTASTNLLLKCCCIYSQWIHKEFSTFFSTSFFLLAIWLKLNLNGGKPKHQRRQKKLSLSVSDVLIYIEESESLRHSKIISTIMEIVNRPWSNGILKIINFAMIVIFNVIVICPPRG